MSELKRILREIDELKRSGQKRLYIYEDIRPETREELEQRGFMVLVGWSHGHYIYVIGWK